MGEQPKKWTVYKGSEDLGEWTDLDKIQHSNQIWLRNELFGFYFRITKIGENQYRISEVQNRSGLNVYYRSLKKSGIDVREIYKIISNELGATIWSEINLQGLMDYGVVEGIFTKLQIEDKANGTHTSEEFISNPVIKAMKDIEWDEYYLLKDIETDEGILEYLEEQMKAEKDDGEISSISLLYQKYKQRVEEKKKKETKSGEQTGVEKLRKFLKENPDITPPDVSLILTEMLAKESDKTNAEQHLVNAMEAQNRGTDQAQYQGS